MSKKVNPEEELHLPPGFRFFPTDEELVIHYLCRKISYQCLPVPFIAEVDLYKYDPWQLPDKALFGEKEWYFLTPRDRKYPNGSRPNRSAGTGYWKATGADKPVRPAGSSRNVGMKKALVFYAGKAPKGLKTNWIMHEYRLADANRPVNQKGSLRLDDWVLCRLYNKKNSCEKPTQQKQEASLSETMDSLEAIEDADLESFRTPESDVESDRFTEVGDMCMQAIHQPQALDGVRTNAAGSFWPGERLKEEREWFMDLESLNDLQNPASLFGEINLRDLVHQEYCFANLCSPLPKPYDDDLMLL